MNRPFAFVCDFDGTVAPCDVGAAFVRRFAAVPGAALEELVQRWRAEELPTRDVIEAESRALRVTERQALEFAGPYQLDHGFAPFVAAARARGDAVEVVSEGFDFYVSGLLRRAGLGDVPYSANRLRFEDGRVVPQFPYAEGCGRCGNCKGARVRRHRRRGFEVVLVGDGLSDRCGARAANRVLARGELLPWCRAQGIAAEPFEDFHDVARWADAHRTKKET